MLGCRRPLDPSWPDLIRPSSLPLPHQLSNAAPRPLHPSFQRPSAPLQPLPAPARRAVGQLGQDRVGSRRSATGFTVHGLSPGTFACRPALGDNGRGRRLGTCRRRSATGITVHGLSRGTFACRPTLGGKGRGRRPGTSRRHSATGATVHGLSPGTFACRPALQGNGRGKCLGTRPHRSATGVTVHGSSRGTFACRPTLGDNGRGRRTGTRPHRSTTGATVHGSSPGTFACRPARPHRAATRTSARRPRLHGVLSEFREPRRPLLRPHQPLDHARPLEHRLPRGQRRRLGTRCRQLGFPAHAAPAAAPPRTARAHPAPPCIQPARPEPAPLEPATGRPCPQALVPGVDPAAHLARGARPGNSSSASAPAVPVRYTPTPAPPTPAATSADGGSTLASADPVAPTPCRYRVCTRCFAPGPACAYLPCVVCALAMLARPSAVRGPVLFPPCDRHRPFAIAGARQAHPVGRAFAPQRGASWGFPRGLPLRSGPSRHRVVARWQTVARAPAPAARQSRPGPRLWTGL